MSKLETWKDIPSYEGYYQVSDLGRVKALSRRLFNGKVYFLSKEIILKPRKNRYGYLQIGLHKENKVKTYTVHNLVVITFIGPISNAKYVINHINFIKIDNRLVNLEIITSRENTNKLHIQSKSKYVGVSEHTYKGKTQWKSRIYINKKSIYLGLFNTQEEAYLKYKETLNNIT